MPSPSLHDYVVAGYFVTRPQSRHEGFNDPDLVPPRVVTASSCFGTTLPDALASATSADRDDDEHRRLVAEELGVPAERMAGVAAFLRARLEDRTWRFPSLLSDVGVARELLAVAQPAGGDLGAYGMALHASEVGRLLEATGGRACTAEGVAEGRPPAPGGRPLGHEPLTHNGGCDPSCSWLCSASEKGVAAALGIRTNANGLIESHDDAIRAARWIDEDESRGEPGPWFAWLLLSY